MKKIYLFILFSIFLPASVQANNPLTPPVSFSITNADETFILHWKNPEKIHYSSINIYRKQANSKSERNMRGMVIYTKIQGDQQEFIDRDVKQGQLYIYALQGVDKDKQPGRFSALRTAVFSDKIPPGKVAVPKAKINEKAIVTLRWKAVTDKDVVTYQVYRGLEGIRALQPVRIILAKDPQLYREQLDPKSPAAYLFAVKAIDGSGNQSPLSDIVRVKVKDIRPPEKPFLTALHPTRNNIELIWTPSSSADVAGYNIYRSTDNWKTSLQLNQKIIPENQFHDDTVEYNQVYSYYITAVDKAGNESKDSGSYSCRSLVEIEVLAPEKIKLRKTKSGQPLLVWENMGKNVRGYLVERRPENRKEFRQVSPLLQNTNFDDLQTMEWSKIEYRLRALYTNGKVSAPSSTVLWQAEDKQGGKK